MRPERQRRGLFLLVLCAFVFAAGATLGTNGYMEKLPAHTKFKCTICHRSESPISGNDLNKFGIDFKENAFAWNGTLAQEDSDGDGQTNGWELGDTDGDGLMDAGQSDERSNPGVRPSSIDQETWGVIKRLFAD